MRPVSYVTVTDVLAQRLGIYDLNASYIPSLLEIDEALHTFDHMRTQEVKQQQTQGAALQKRSEEFAAEFMQTRAGIRKAVKENVMMPKKKKYETTTSQAAAKQCIPPGCSIWQRLTRQEWRGHCPPRRRIQALWAEHSENGAKLWITQTLWRQWLAQNGLELSACPWEGLL